MLHRMLIHFVQPYLIQPAQNNIILIYEVIISTPLIPSIRSRKHWESLIIKRFLLAAQPNSRPKAPYGISVPSEAQHLPKQYPSILISYFRPTRRIYRITREPARCWIMPKAIPPRNRRPLHSLPYPVPVRCQPI